MIKVKYIGDYYKASFEPGKTYDVLEVIWPFPKMPSFKIHDEMGDIAYYFWSDFEIVSGSDEFDELCRQNANEQTGTTLQSGLFQVKGKECRIIPEAHIAGKSWGRSTRCCS